MYVEMGNPTPVQCVYRDGVHIGHAPIEGLGGAPAVTYINIPEGDHADGGPLYGFDPDADVAAISRHLLTRPDGITSLPGHEALLAVIHPAGLTGHHFGGRGPSWVRATERRFADLLARFYEVPVLEPGDASFEDTHFTIHGAPGVVPGAATDLQANITQNGRDIWARALGGGQVGFAGTASSGTAPTATVLTDSGTPGWTANQWVGARVVCGGVWGNIVSNTTTALTVDRWYAPATPGGAAGATPAASAAYVILDGNAPSWFVGISANTTAPASPSTSTSLTGEITTAGGGLVRKIAPYAHTAGANTFTLTPVFTANTSDTLPVTVAKIGVFDSMVVGDTTSTMLFETLLSATATLSSSGDQLTVTETVTGT